MILRNYAPLAMQNSIIEEIEHGLLEEKIKNKMIRLTGYFDRFGSKADGSASLSFSTQELGPEDFANFQKDLHQFGWIMFAPNSDTPPEAPDEAPEQEGKSLSERLRAIYFVRWKQLKDAGKTDKDFESYRRMNMEAMIESIKAKLD